MMKVLIETIKNRKGYKHFKDKDAMNDYLSKHSKSIANYEILNEYDVAVEETNEMLQSFIDDCETIHNKLFWLFRQHERMNEKYSLKLINAAGRVYDGISAIKKCLR